VTIGFEFFEFFQVGINHALLQVEGFAGHPSSLCGLRLLLEGPNNAQDTADNRENIGHVLLHLPHQDRNNAKAWVNLPHEPWKSRAWRAPQDYANVVCAAPVFNQGIHRGVGCAKTDPTIKDEEEPVGGDQRARVGEPGKEEGEAHQVPVLEHPKGEYVRMR
jgi:hypothetical protein